MDVVFTLCSHRHVRPICHCPCEGAIANRRKVGERRQRGQGRHQHTKPIHTHPYELKGGEGVLNKRTAHGTRSKKRTLLAGNPVPSLFVSNVIMTFLLEHHPRTDTHTHTHTLRPGGSGAKKSSKSCATFDTVSYISPAKLEGPALDSAALPRSAYSIRPS